MRKTIVLAGAAALAACSWPLTPLPPPAPVPVASAPSLQALAEQGRYVDAIALLETQAAAGGRPSAALLADLGYAYYLDGRLLPALAALERACLMEPGNALAWERLASLLEAGGDSGRAFEAMRQARRLRELAAEGSDAGRSEAGDAQRRAAGGEGGGALWPAGMARVEVRQVSAGLVEVARVPAPQDASPATMSFAGGQRLEVSNGNGVRGMAAAVARRLRAEGMHVVRLTNTRPFNVAQTRVEVRADGVPQLRIVLGRDLALAKPEIKKPPGVSRRQAP